MINFCRKKKKKNSEVSVDLFIIGTFARNQTTICNANFDRSTEYLHRKPHREKTLKNGI